MSIDVYLAMHEVIDYTVLLGHNYGLGMSVPITYQPISALLIEGIDVPGSDAASCMQRHSDDACEYDVHS